jgi:hypothetical protein
MPGFEPGIHLFLRKDKMDCRVKPGNDELEFASFQPRR